MPDELLRSTWSGFMQGVTRMPEEARFILGLAYQAGPDPRITKGMDGGRDYFEPESLERAAWTYLAKGNPRERVGQAR